MRPDATDCAKRAVAAMRANGLPEAPGEVLDARWIIGTDDWWVQTPMGWYWLDGRKKAWKQAPLGPP